MKYSAKLTPLRSLLLYIEGANYFEPVENVLDDGIVSHYERNLNSIFSLNNITENQFYFLVRPSFEPEHLLIVERLQEKYILTLTVLVKNYWEVFYAGNKTIDIDKQTSTSEINKAIGDKLFTLLDKAITEARPPKANGFTLDGVGYKLSKILDGKLKVVSKHSPSGDSKSGRVINVIKQLICNIETLDDTILLKIEIKIDNLLN